MQITPIGLNSVAKIKKYLKDIVVIPAIKHNISSGKKGSKNASPKNNFPLLFNISAYLSAFSFPATQTTSLYPNVLPSKNEVYEPIKTPSEQYTLPQNGPYTTAPARAMIVAGTGRNTTCKA